MRYIRTKKTRISPLDLQESLAGWSNAPAADLPARPPALCDARVVKMKIHGFPVGDPTSKSSHGICAAFMVCTGISRLVRSMARHHPLVS